MIYCLSCKKKTADNNLQPKITTKKRPYMTANCLICKKIKSQFSSIKQINGNGVLSQLFKNILFLSKIF